MISTKIANLVFNIRKDCAEAELPPEEGAYASGQLIVPRALVKKTRGYIEKTVTQINGCYEKGWYDASAVMLRRLLETLIIESFEAYEIADKIKNKNGDFFFLADLIDAILKEKTWNLSRNTKTALPRLKDIGDKSAHSRRFNALRSDLDSIRSDVRVIIQELICLAKLK